VGEGTQEVYEVEFQPENKRRREKGGFDRGPSAEKIVGVGKLSYKN